MKRVILGLALCAVLPSQEPLEINDQVHVRRRLISPREVFRMPRAMPPAVLVFLTDYHLRFTYPEQKSEEIRGKPGEFCWHRGGVSGFENLTGRQIVMIRVAPQFGNPSAPAGGAVKRMRQNFENERVQVLRIEQKPRQRTPRVRGRGDVAIFLTDAHLRFTQPDGRTEETHAKAGDVMWKPSGAYTSENLSDQPVQWLWIILKE